MALKRELLRRADEFKPEEAQLTTDATELLQLSCLPSVQDKSNRGYVDGCFDLCHSGHFNAIRQAAQVIGTLVIGVNSDDDILRHKGPTILNEKERISVIKAVKWGHEVQPNTPYEPNEVLLDALNCQYFIHGDDPVMVDGVNVNDHLAAIGRFKEVRRTTGVSTTDITGKLLKLINKC